MTRTGARPTASGRGSNQYQNRPGAGSGDGQRSLSATAAARTAVEAFTAERDVSGRVDVDTWETYLPPDPLCSDTDTRMRLACSSNPLDREDAAADPDASRDVLRRTIRDADLNVRVVTAANRNAPTDVLERAVTDPDAQVRHAAVTNPSASDAVVAAALTDPDRAVSMAAQQASQVRGVRL